MTLGRLIQIRGWLAYGLAAVYLIAGTVGFFVSFDDTSDRVLWLVLLYGGAALAIAGLLLADGASWTSGVLVSLGGVAGGLPLLGTILVPFAVAALIALSFAISRRSLRTV